MLAFVYGLLWMLMVGVQVKMLAGHSNNAFLFVWTFGASSIWCLLVRKVTIDKTSMWWYSIGTAIGAVLAGMYSFGGLK